MDQLKTYLDVLKKHHFWPLVVVIILAGLYAWKSGKAHYDQLFAQGSSELKGVFDKVNTVANTQQHPNQFFIDEGKKLNAKLKDDVKAAWQRLYDNQKEVLIWEPVFAEIANLKPTAAIPERLRTIYWDYSKDQMPKLFQKIDTREEKKLDAAAAASTKAPADDGQVGDDVPPGAVPGSRRMGASTEKKVELTGTVVWPETERIRIANTYNWPRQPRSKQIRYAQEDLWVYGALLDIITDANAGVKDAGSVAIKKIEALDIAQGVPAPNNAAFPVPEGTIATVEAQPAGATTMAKSGKDGPTDEELDNGRYVSPDGAPLAVPDSNAQFKLMPIRMRLIMDQRKLPDLLVACANSRLPVEVRQVQLNVGEGDTRAPSGGGRSMGSGSGGSMASRGGGPRPAPTAAATGSARQAAFDPLIVQTPYDQRIEIRGFIYIFNPPDLSAMGGEEVVEESAEEAAATETETTERATTEPAAEEAPAEEKAPAEPAADEKAAPAAAVEGEAPATAEGEAAPAGEATPEAPASEEPKAGEPAAAGAQRPG